MIRWSRYRDGDDTTVWTATVGGKHLRVANMQGQSVRYTGVGRHVLVWETDSPDPFAGSWREVGSEYTVRDAKAWVAEHYGSEGKA